MSEEQIVDVVFPVRGRRLPGDHGYALFAALCRELPELHDAGWLAVHPIRGPRRIDGDVSVRMGSRLALRIPVARIATVLPLAGRKLVVGGQDVWLGALTVEALRASSSLDSKIVVIKVTRPQQTSSGSLDKHALATRVTDAMLKQLAGLGVEAELALAGRRELRVGGRRVVGYSVRLTGLSEPHSLAVQTHGLGGKRRMGCGVFVPTRSK